MWDTCRVLLLALLLGCGGDASPPGQDPAPDAGGPMEDPSAYVFDDGAFRHYELTVDPADWQWLNENALLEEYVPATLHFEGQEVGPIGLRYKGGFGTLRSCFDAGGNRTCPKVSMKLKFNEYVADLRFYGLKRLNFHSMIRDPSMMHDRLGYGLFNEMGVAAPRAVHGTLTINGEPQGVFAIVEQIDGRFSRSRFPDGGEGNVYKEVWPVHDAPQPYLDALRTNEDENPDVTPMIRFAADLAAATDATFPVVLDSWMDVDALMRYLAVDRLIDNWDGIVAWYCLGGMCFNHNYYWYQEVGRDFLWLIPWDLDNTFQVPSPVRTYYGMPDWNEVPSDCTPIPIFLGINGRPPACDPFLRRLATVLWPRYVQATQVLLDGPFQIAALEEKLDRWEAQIADAVAADPNIEGVAQWQDALRKLRSDLPTLRMRIEAQIQ